MTNLIPIVIYYKNGLSENYQLQYPNGSNGIEFGLADVGEHIYRDLDKNLRKGTALKRVKLTMKYSSHRINLFKLLSSESVEFDLSIFTIPFSNTIFKFDDTSVKKTWFANLPLTLNDPDVLADYENLNPVPAGEITLRFISVEPYKKPV